MAGPRKAPAKKAAQKKVELGGYIEVKDRIVEFREKYPDGRLRPLDPANPYKIERVGDQTFIVYVAAAYRDPTDPLPGIGAAWEPFPGKTSFTRDSELQNAETSAWGRAMVAALAADAHAGIASADEMRGRRQTPDEPKRDPAKISPKNVEAMVARCVEMGVSVAEVVRLTTDGRSDDPADLFVSEIPAARDIAQGLAVASTTVEEPPAEAPETERALDAGGGGGVLAAPDPSNDYDPEQEPF